MLCKNTDSGRIALLDSQSQFSFLYMVFINFATSASNWAAPQIRCLIGCWLEQGGWQKGARGCERHASVPRCSLWGVSPVQGQVHPHPIPSSQHRAAHGGWNCHLLLLRYVRLSSEVTSPNSTQPARCKCEIQQYSVHPRPKSMEIFFPSLN